jgi:hypothetical protein
MNQRSWILIGVAAAFVVSVAAYALSPLLAFNALNAAAKSGDRDRLEQVVDFPAVRENLKSQLAAGLVKSISGDPEMRDNPFAAVGALLVPALTDRMVDSVITPDGIAMVLSQGKVSAPGGEPTAGTTPTKEAANLQTKLSYRTLNRFRAELQRRDQPGVTLALTLERRGLFGWKLVRIDIPQSLFNPTPPKARVSVADAGPPAALASPAPASDEAASSGSDLCRAVALARVPSIENPESALAPGEIDEAVTQYVVSKKTGVGSFCSHGGYCYPRFKSEAGKSVEVLHLQNCRIGAKAFEDADDTTYSVDLDRSKNSQADLKYNDLKNTLSGMNLCSACADNAAQYYLQKPTSECGVLVKRALEGDPASKSKLEEFPDYCQWR